MKSFDFRLYAESEMLIHNQDEMLKSKALGDEGSPGVVVARGQNREHHWSGVNCVVRLSVDGAMVPLLAANFAIS